MLGLGFTAWGFRVQAYQSSHETDSEPCSTRREYKLDETANPKPLHSKPLNPKTLNPKPKALNP